MKLDLESRLTAALIIGSVVFLGNAVASLFGIAVDRAIIGGSVTVILGALGVGLFRGSS